MFSFQGSFRKKEALKARLFGQAQIVMRQRLY